MELAGRIGLKQPQSISRYETGVSEAPKKRIRAIAQETKKPLSFFYEEAEATPGVVTVELEQALAAMEARLYARFAALEERLGLLEHEPEPRAGTNGLSAP